MDVDKAVIYAEIEGFRPLELDLYRPDPPPDADDAAGAGADPLLVYVHGGGWRVSHKARAPRETRAWTPGFFERLTAAGFVVASIEYRFSGEARFPAQLDDVVAALAWLHEQAADPEAERRGRLVQPTRGDLAAEHHPHSSASRKHRVVRPTRSASPASPARPTRTAVSSPRALLNVDAARTFLWGASAGGHLSALAALVPEVPPVAGVVCWYPITDLPALDRTATGSFEAHLLGGPIGEHLDAARAASPVTHARPGAPPFLLQHGDRDEMVPVDQSVRLAAALRAHGVAVELEVVAGADHFFAGAPDVEPLFTRAVAFLRTLAQGAS